MCTCNVHTLFRLLWFLGEIVKLARELRHAGDGKGSLPRLADVRLPGEVGQGVEQVSCIYGPSNSLRVQSTGIQGT